jgi:uncharacterized protein YdeI (YjbR/CyaY-like superfamily)
MGKKHTGVASLDWAGAVDVALCFGWIDGRSKRIDDDWFVQRFTPRRPQSTWSKVNRQKVEALIAAGRMRPAGLAEIERAKADGRWEAAYDGMATSAVPEDLAAALEAAGLTDAFAELSRQNRYAILHRVQTAKKAETQGMHDGQTGLPGALFTSSKKRRMASRAEISTSFCSAGVCLTLGSSREWLASCTV